MKRIYIFLTIFLLMISVTSFGADKKILIAYFSRAGENYNVGTVSKGSTEVIAEMIAKETGGDLFKIEPVNPYPLNYNDTVRIARDEKRNNARPKIKNKVKNLKDYDVVFVGYPIWHGDLPMAVYTFFDENNLSGKKIILFSTNEGSGLADTVNTIEKYTKGNVVKNVFSIRGKIQKIK
ncbi:flavodoxin [Fusobacterium animalis]|uniref:Flavodoxin n=1 Tax=Fusobacterium animalis TaxID=76859 RepID=A0A2G9FJ67_9FUSO|nr:flavodoxin [Fusobacterium animalis]PIM93187.1 flavodoxin [Fusobacterium animalis]PIM94729.1 flavodoxin [Fusobacterium animalis]